jgi:hypothetical protein
MMTTSMTAIDLKHFITDYTDVVWNHGNVVTTEHYYAPDYIYHDVSRSEMCGEPHDLVN